MKDFERVEEFDGNMDTIFPDKVLKNRRGMTPSVTTIAPRVTGILLPDPTVKWWHMVKDFDVAWSEEGGESNDGHSTYLTALTTFDYWGST